MRYFTEKDTGRGMFHFASLKQGLGMELGGGIYDKTKTLKTLSEYHEIYM